MQQAFGTQGLNAEWPWLPPAAEARQQPPASAAVGQTPPPWREAEPCSMDLKHGMGKIVRAVPPHNTKCFALVILNWQHRRSQSTPDSSLPWGRGGGPVCPALRWEEPSGLGFTVFQGMRVPGLEVGGSLLEGRASPCREGFVVALEGQKAGGLTTARSSPVSHRGLPIVLARAGRELWQLPEPGAQRLLRLPSPTSKLAY